MKWILLLSQHIEDRILKCCSKPAPNLSRKILPTGLFENFYTTHKIPESAHENILQRSQFTVSKTGTDVHFQGRCPPEPGNWCEGSTIAVPPFKCLHSEKSGLLEEEGGERVSAGSVQHFSLHSLSPPIDVLKGLGQRSALQRSQGQTSSDEYGGAPLSGDHLVKLIGIQTNEPAERGHISSITAHFPGHKEMFARASSARQQVQLQLSTPHFSLEMLIYSGYWVSFM